MHEANVFSDESEYDESDPAGYRSGVAQVGKAAGGEDDAMLRRCDGDVDYWDGER
jgi:hypothetical protein